MPGHVGNRKKKGPQTAFEFLMIWKKKKKKGGIRKNEEKRERDCKDQ